MITFKKLLALAGGVFLVLLIYTYWADKRPRARVLQGLELGAGLKVVMYEYFETHGKWPQNNAEAGLNVPNQISGVSVRSMTISRTNDTSKGIGILTIQFNDTLNNKRLVWIGQEVNGEVIWQCLSNSTQTPPAGVPAGTVSSRDVPSKCR